MKFKLPQIFVITILHSIVPDNPCESESFLQCFRNGWCGVYEQ